MGMATPAPLQGASCKTLKSRVYGKAYSKGEHQCINFTRKVPSDAKICLGILSNIESIVTSLLQPVSRIAFPVLLILLYLYVQKLIRKPVCMNPMFIINKYCWCDYCVHTCIYIGMHLSIPIWTKTWLEGYFMGNSLFLTIQSARQMDSPEHVSSSPCFASHFPSVLQLPVTITCMLLLTSLGISRNS